MFSTALQFMQTNSQKIRDRLTQILREKGTRAAHLAESMGVSRSYLSQMMNGTRDISPATAQKMAAALGVTMADLSGIPADAPGAGIPSMPLERAKDYAVINALSVEVQAVIKAMAGGRESLAAGKEAAMALCSLGDGFPQAPALLRLIERIEHEQEGGPSA